MEKDASIAAARNFTRDLNILLKTVRLYGFEHDRTAALFDAAWRSLSAALQTSGETGLLLGVSGSQVLMDGIPLEARPVDRSFAQILSSSGLSSIHFSAKATSDDFGILVRAFASRGTRSAALGPELMAALSAKGKPAIVINEVRFVAQDSALADANLAGQLAAKALGVNGEKLKTWLEDPQKLLQLIAAAEGARSGKTGEGVLPGAGVASGPPSAGAASEGAGTPSPDEAEVLNIIRLLNRLGQDSSQEGGKVEAGSFQTQVRGLAPAAQFTLAQALSALASISPTAKPDTPLLLQLAEQVAIRFALDRFERGDMQVNAVVQLLSRLKGEIKALREVMKVHEDKMSKAGLQVESFADVLDRQFWAGVPEAAKRRILLSPEAWAIPPRNVRQLVEDLLNRGEDNAARAILLNYIACLRATDAEARKKTWAGLNELADLYHRAGGPVLQGAVQELGDGLIRESDPELQTLISAGFVRFSHEAAGSLHYPAVEQSLRVMENLEGQHPTLAQTLWPRVKVGFRLQEFVDDALRHPEHPPGLLEVLRRMPHAAVEHIASRLQHCSRREERERLVVLAGELGEEGVTQLRRMLECRPPSEAALTVALLSRLEPGSLAGVLARRLRTWERPFHDQVVRQLSISGAPELGKLLVSLIDVLDPAMLPEAVDEIGMSGDAAAASRVMRFVEESDDSSTDPYLRLKAIEALGRLRETRSESVLRRLVEARQFLRWQHPRELRITALQTLMKIDPDWARTFLSESGLTPAELRLAPMDPERDTPWVRQRRYERIVVPNLLKGTVNTQQGDTPFTVNALSLGGGVATCQRHLKPGTVTRLELQSGRPRIHADVVVREARPQELSFELVKIDLEDRSRLRRPLVEISSHRV